MFWKKKKTKKENKIVLGMVLNSGENDFNIDDFVSDYNRSYNEDIKNIEGDNHALSFTVDGESVAIAYMDFPIPSDDIQGTAQYAYNWETALEDTKDHKSHFIVSLIWGSEDQVKRFKILTKVICSLLRTTESIGVYKGSQSLLIGKKDYLTYAGFMSDDDLPLNLWIYFGLRSNNTNNSGYTYGLKAFDKTEMEILNSTHNLEDIREFLYNMSHYVLASNVEFKDGETCGTSLEEKININLSKGKFVEEDSLKLAF